MAKRRSADPAKPTGEPDYQRSMIVRLELPADAHDRLRVIAAEARQSMAAFARSVVLKAIAEAPRKKSAK